MGPSASTGEHCICIVSDLLWFGLVWSCFVFCLLFLLFYVICAPVLTEGTQSIYLKRKLSVISRCKISPSNHKFDCTSEKIMNPLQRKTFYVEMHRYFVVHEYLRETAQRSRGDTFFCICREWFCNVVFGKDIATGPRPQNWF